MEDLTSSLTCATPGGSSAHASWSTDKT